jgi:hypothetical protein
LKVGQKPWKPFFQLNRVQKSLPVLFKVGQKFYRNLFSVEQSSETSPALFKVGQKTLEPFLAEENPGVSIHNSTL